jgi:4-hydroxy-3-polyprenylbenzoate decarboxylase
MSEPKRVVLGISGASGAVYGVRLAEVLGSRDDVELHLVVSGGAAATIGYETSSSLAEVESHAHTVYPEKALGSAIASGTFQTYAMVVAPCSMRSLSAIASSANDTLLVRAADVHLKERRPLVLVVRETPLHRGHLRLMLDVTENGGVILPPVPGFYTRPATVADVVDHTVGKVLDQLRLQHDVSPPWTGLA